MVLEHLLQSDSAIVQQKAVNDLFGTGSLKGDDQLDSWGWGLGRCPETETTKPK